MGANFNLRRYNFSIAANGTQNLDVVGDYVRIMSATGTVRLRTVEGWSAELSAGQGVRYAPFNRLILEDLSGAVNTGTLFIGTGDPEIIDNTVNLGGSVTVSSGTVTITNDSFNRAKAAAGTMFGGMWATTLATSATSLAVLQLWNPVGSTRNLAVYAWEAFSTDTTVFLDYVHAYGDVDVNANNGTPINRLMTGAAPVSGAKLNWTLAAATPIATYNLTRYAHNQTAQTGPFAAVAPRGNYSLEGHMYAQGVLALRNNPIIVPPGRGLTTVIQHSNGTARQSMIQYLFEEF